jgi:hypothetical protein
MLGPRKEYWGACLIQGETDAPDHCYNCGVLLPTPLTSDGEQYVKERVLTHSGDPIILDLWRSRFGYVFES